MNRAKRSKAVPPGAQIFGARFNVVARQLLTAKCEVGWPGMRDCFHNSPDRRREWCWPCTVRWSVRVDAAKFVAPKDDVIQLRAVRGRG